MKICNYKHLIISILSFMPLTIALSQTDGIYNVVKFGAKGNGTTDCSAAFQRAVDKIIEDGGGQLFIPRGHFLINKQIIASNQKEIFLSIRGLGLGVSVIECNNNAGVFKISYRSNNSQVTIKDLSFFAKRPGAGTAIDIAFLNRGNAHHRSLMMENVEMRSKDNSCDYFDVGIRADNVWRPIFTSVVFAGPFGKEINDDRSIHSLQYKPKVAFDVSGSYAPKFVCCYAWSAKVGYKLIDMDEQGAEDGMLLNSYAVECMTGVEAITKGAEPQLFIDGCHLNCRDFGIKISGRKFVNIVNCLMYNIDLDNQAPNYTDIYLENCNNIIISSNIFHFKGNKERTNVLVKSSSNKIDVKDNRFNAYAIAVKVEKGAKDINFTNNGFAEYVNQKLIDLSEGHVITDILK